MLSYEVLVYSEIPPEIAFSLKSFPFSPGLFRTPGIGPAWRGGRSHMMHNSPASFASDGGWFEESAEFLAAEVFLQRPYSASKRTAHTNAWKRWDDWC
jgi:hypothetical protein